jgi:hypothetical protein
MLAYVGVGRATQKTGAARPEGWLCRSCPQRLFFHRLLFGLQYRL